MISEQEIKEAYKKQLVYEIDLHKFHLRRLKDKLGEDRKVTISDLKTDTLKSIFLDHGFKEPTDADFIGEEILRAIYIYELTKDDKNG